MDKDIVEFLRSDLRGCPRDLEAADLITELRAELVEKQKYILGLERRSFQFDRTPKG
jgi:hypothetical protein